LGKESGSQELSRIATAYTASLAFGVTFLVALACGCELGSALLRASIVLGAAMFAGRLLSAPVIDVVLAALARDESKRRAEQQKHEAEP